MKNYFNYLLIIVFTIFSFYYTSRVSTLSKENNVILTFLESYSKEINYECNEGYITDSGIVLGLNGLKIDVERSYVNMKGIGFDKDLIEYKKDKCILNKDDNKDKYIIGTNQLTNNVSIIIDIDSFKYIKEFKKINNNINIMINYKNYNKYRNDLINETSILLKGNKYDFENLNKIDINVYCAKTNNYDVINICKENNLNSIKVNKVINNNLLYEIKNSLYKNNIIFIKENLNNLNEFKSTINYIKSRGKNIVSLDELLL